MHDCLIVGGGVMGLSLAWELARLGVSVHVIDLRAPGESGGGASWAGAGILPPANAARAVHPLDQLRGLSFNLHAAWSHELRERTGIDNGFRRCGGLYLARSAGEAAFLAGLAALFAEEEIPFQPIPADALARLEPALAPAASRSDSPTAWLAPGECQIRDPRHLRALEAACRQWGVEFTFGIAWERFELRGDRAVAAHVSGRRIEAGQFFVAAGAWGRQLLQPLGVAIGVLPIRGQMVLFRSPQPLIRRIVNVGSRYLVPRDDGYLLCGSTEEEVGFCPETTPEGVDELVQVACEIVPALRDARIEKSWAGLRPGSFDGLPYMGQVPGLENVFASAGHFRSGLFLSPGAAVVMSRLMLRLDPGMDLAPFRLGRG